MLSDSLEERLEALAYWRQRRARLPWYRRSARREAERMVAAWEPRVRSALVLDPRAPLPVRLNAAGLVLRTHAGRAVQRVRRAALMTVAAVSAAFLASVALIHLIA
ncbi:MAG TPA: hypothetical protein VF752_01505 [Thermoleophilaceae bacterium]